MLTSAASARRRRGVRNGRAAAAEAEDALREAFLKVTSAQVSALKLDVKTKLRDAGSGDPAAAAEAKDALSEARLKLASAQEDLKNANAF